MHVKLSYEFKLTCIFQCKSNKSEKIFLDPLKTLLLSAGLRILKSFRSSDQAGHLCMFTMYLGSLEDLLLCQSYKPPGVQSLPDHVVVVRPHQVGDVRGSVLKGASDFVSRVVETGSVGRGGQEFSDISLYLSIKTFH